MNYFEITSYSDIPPAQPAINSIPLSTKCGALFPSD